MLQRVSAAFFIAMALAASGPVKKQKKADPTTAVTDAAIKQAREAVQQRIADCVVEGAPQGAWAATVKATVKINSDGQVMSADIKVEPERPDRTRACIDQVLRAVKYPKNPAPLISISR